MEGLERLRALMASEATDASVTDLIVWLRQARTGAEAEIGCRYVLDHLEAWPPEARVVVVGSAPSLVATADAAWAVVEAARPGRGGEATLVMETIVRELAGMPPLVGVACAAWLLGFDASASAPPLRAAHRLVDRDADEDGFDAFRCWLLSRGRASFEAALSEPDGMAAWSGTDDLAQVVGLRGLSTWGRVGGMLGAVKMAGAAPADPWTGEVCLERLPRLVRRFMDPKAVRDLELKAMMRARAGGG